MRVFFIVFKIEKVTHVFLFPFFTASSLLNWSYQNNKACCSVLVDENKEVVPSSKTTISETNLSTSSKPKPSSGGNFLQHVSELRKRRHVPNPPHASVLHNRNSTLYGVNSNITKHDSDSNVKHASTNTVAPLHDMNFVTNDVSLINVDITTNNPKSNDSVTVSSMPYENFSRISIEDISHDPTTLNIETETTASEATYSHVENSVEVDVNLTTTTTKYNNSTTTQLILNEYDSNEDSEDISNEDPFYESNPSQKILDIIDMSNVTSNDKKTHINVTTLENNTLSNDKTFDSRIKKDLHDPKHHTIEDTEQEDSLNLHRSDEIEIVKLNGSNITSTTMKSGIAYNYDSTLKEKFELKDPNVLNNEVKENLTDESSKELTDYNLAAAENRGYVYDLKKISNLESSHDESIDLNDATNILNNKTHSNILKSLKNNDSPFNIKIIEVPPSSNFNHSSTDNQNNNNNNNNNNNKRVTINVTIATEPNSNEPSATQNLYVLSVSIPTTGNLNESPNINVNTHAEPHSLALKQLSPQKEFAASPSSSITNSHMPLNATSDKSFGFWGGECQCSCPCLDDYDNFTDTGDDYIEDVENIVNMSTSLEEPSFNNFTNTTENEPSTTMDPNNTDSIENEWKTKSACPENTTKNPPTPTILILEGRIVAFT